MTASVRRPGFSVQSQRMHVCVCVPVYDLYYVYTCVMVKYNGQKNDIWIPFIEGRGASTQHVAIG